jgi:hypothetical protein
MKRVSVVVLVFLAVARQWEQRAGVLAAERDEARRHLSPPPCRLLFPSRLSLLKKKLLPLPLPRKKL